MTQGRRQYGYLMSGLWLVLSSWAHAGNTETDVKAAFIYNFTKFVEWPKAVLAPGAPLQLCALGKDDLSNRLNLLHGREAQGHELHIRSLSALDDWRGCHIMFIARENDTRLDQLQKALGDAAVLTVSDIPDFTRKGGMIGLFVESNRVQFMINLDIAQRAGLKLSARMLQLARITRPGEK